MKRAASLTIGGRRTSPVRLGAAALVALGLSGAGAVPAMAQIAPSPPQLVSTAGGAPVGNISTEFAPAISDDGRLVCFMHLLPSGLYGATCSARGAGLTWGSQQWGTFTGVAQSAVGVAGNGAVVAVISQSGALNVCTGSLTFGCRVVPLGLGATAPDSATNKIAGISADGRYVLVVTTATNVIAGDTNAHPDLVRVDTLTGAVLPMNTMPGGALSPTGGTGGALSRNGRYAAIVSQDGLVAGQAPTTAKQVFVRDIDGGVVRQASVTPGAGNGNDWSGNPTISDNGRYVAFSSFATNLLPTDTNGEQDLYLRDLDLGRTQRLSLGPSGEQLAAGIGDRWSEPRWMSGDGRIIVYPTSDRLYGGRPPVPGDPGLRQVVVHNVGTGMSRIASTSPSGGLGDGDSSGIAITGNARYVSFASSAGNLRGQAPGSGVYVRNMDNTVPVASMRLTGGGPAPVTVTVDGTASADADGSVTAHRWDFGDGTTASGPTATHTYPNAGTYTVRLTVTDDEGAEALAEQQVVVGNPVIRITRSGASVDWSLAKATGRITLSGTSSGRVSATFVLVSGAKRLPLATRQLQGGAFTLRFTVPPGLRPGTYRVDAVPAGAAAATGGIVAGRLAIRAPEQGIIDDLGLVSASGRRLGGIPPAGAKRVAVRFRVLVAPRRGISRITAEWTSPLGFFKVSSPTPVDRKGLVRFAFTGPRSGPLPRGRYQARIMSAGKQLGVVRFRVIR